MEQNLKNHSRYVPGYHFITTGILLLTTIGAIRNLIQSFDDEHRLYNAALILALVVVAWLLFWYIRVFPLRAQDRLILLEERLRHQQLTGKPLDPRLRPSQVIALRFAGDAEFAALAQKAADENLPAGEIKKLIHHWKADRFRV